MHITRKTVYLVDSKSFGSLSAAQDYLENQLADLLRHIFWDNGVHSKNHIGLIENILEERQRLIALLDVTYDDDDE